MKAFQLLENDLPNINDIFEACHLQDSLKLKNGAIVHYFPEPGINFSEATKDLIYSVLVPVTSYAFGADMTGYWEDRKSGNYFDRLSEFAFVVTPEGKIIAWTGHSVITDPQCVIVYNDSSGVIPPYQKKGIMEELLSRRTVESVVGINHLKCPVYFAARTESPIIYKIRRRTMKRIYPSPDYPTPEMVLQHVRILAGWLGQLDKLEPNSLIVRNAYAMVDELYGELPTSGDSALDTWIAEQLGPRDAFLLMGEPK